MLFSNFTFRKTLSLISLVVIVIVIGNYVIVAQDRPDMKIDTATQKRVLSEVTKDLSENYVFPDLAKKMSADINSRFAKGEYAKLLSANQFANTLTKNLRAISKDKHLRVRFSEREIPIRQTRTKPTEDEQKRYVAQLKQRNFGFEKVERMQGNVGYIDLRGFSDHEMGAKTVDAAMNFLANTDALIFDLRRNGGGSPRMVALISSYLFSDKRVHLNDLYWRKGDSTNEFWTDPEKASVKFNGKEIYILTSKRTFSAAEEFSYNLRNLKRATIVGETTGGGAHPGGMFRLDKHFQAFISTGRAISPITKTNWEGTGVKPHIPVAKEIALKTAYKMALEKLAPKQNDRRSRSAMERKIKEIEKELAKK
mgnify:FL=1